MSWKYLMGGAVVVMRFLGRRGGGMVVVGMFAGFAKS
jgi:hypothetical protein